MTDQHREKRGGRRARGGQPAELGAQIGETLRRGRSNANIGISIDA
ncbi:hypothetical protein [Paraburkholderia bryophila]|uniref:Uncharacterized protein n=1 Tax=Paraburkholderia bryophila TaxID=420952 RepID=A0A7Y9W6I3_9BURK|nr:hypothetical protein [Paraburkholderia bryophila]NYH15100.1 hypothetical protein [Paraburkholderia bryophila]